jgi:hypothetical protein
MALSSALVVQRTSVDGEAPPWAVLDATGHTLLNVSVETADGSAHALVSRGAALPAHGAALLTTSAHQSNELRLRLLVGARVTAASCHRLGVVLLPVRPAERGLAQARLVVDVRANRLIATAHDVQTGKRVRLVLTHASPATDDDAADGTRDQHASTLPSLWRFETPCARLTTARRFSPPHAHWAVSPRVSPPHAQLAVSPPLGLAWCADRVCFERMRVRRRTLGAPGLLVRERTLDRRATARWRRERP